MVDPSLERYYYAAFDKWGLTDPLCRFWWRQHFLGKFRKNDVTWRHHVGFSKKVQKIFILLILCCGPNMKSFAQFKRKLWTITFFQIWSRDNKKAKLRQRTWFSDPVYIAILNQLIIIFPTVYNMTSFGDIIFFLPLWRHRENKGDVTEKLPDETFQIRWKWIVHTLYTKKKQKSPIVYFFNLKTVSR